MCHLRSGVHPIELHRRAPRLPFPALRRDAAGRPVARSTCAGLPDKQYVHGPTRAIPGAFAREREALAGNLKFAAVRRMFLCRMLLLLVLPLDNLRLRLRYARRRWTRLGMHCAARKEVEKRASLIC